MFAGALLGFRVLAHNRLRFAAGIACVGMAVTIMLTEIGLLMGLLNAQALVADLLRADLVIMNVARTHLHRWDRLEPVRLSQAAALPDVNQVVPIYEDSVEMKSPSDKRLRRIMVFAVPPDNLPLVIGKAPDISKSLRLSGGMLFDRLSRPIFGQLRLGAAVELDRVPQTVTGYAAIGPDIINDGAVVMSEGDWLNRDSGAQPIMGAIFLKPGANLNRARNDILAALPHDVSVLTPSEMKWREYDFTLSVAPIGFIFAVGVAAGLVIGTITCYQLLYNEVVDRLKQFATLKAMGFGKIFLRGVILGQAIPLGLLGFALGAVVAAATDLYLAQRTSLPIALDTNSTLIVFFLALVMCVIAGTLAMSRVARADPASLY